jgi:hypothetical protein
MVPLLLGSSVALVTGDEKESHRALATAEVLSMFSSAAAVTRIAHRGQRHVDGRPRDGA